jgi:hypothetical protein
LIGRAAELRDPIVAWHIETSVMTSLSTVRLGDLVADVVPDKRTVVLPVAVRDTFVVSGHGCSRRVTPTRANGLPTP